LDFVDEKATRHGEEITKNRGCGPGSEESEVSRRCVEKRVRGASKVRGDMQRYIPNGSGQK